MGAERAVKSINLAKMKNPRRFQSEIDVAKSLDHPNVVRLFETFQDGGKHVFLVLELCTGGELFDRLVEEAPKGFDEHRVAVYIRQMFAAVAYLHSRRFAHRDIKLENFLLQNRSDDAVLKLIDFGFACQFKPGVPMTSKSGPHTISLPKSFLARMTRSAMSGAAAWYHTSSFAGLLLSMEMMILRSCGKWPKGNSSSACLRGSWFLLTPKSLFLWLLPWSQPNGQARLTFDQCVVGEERCSGSSSD